MLVILAILCYFTMQTIELVSFGSRVAGKVSGNLALGTTLHHSIYVGSRFFLVPFLPILAFLVETGISLKDYLMLVFLALLVTSLMSIFILLRFNFFQTFFQIVFSKYALSSTIPLALMKSVFGLNTKYDFTKNCEKFSIKLISLKKVIVSFIAYSFLVTGFFVAFLLAIIFPEYQLTLSQSTAFFHGFGAILVAFYLDPMLSRSMDNRKNNQIWLINAYSIILGRVMSYIVFCVVFLIIYIIF